MENVKVNALMLRATDYGENDKILTLLTAERGRLTATAKGVKKAGAKLKFAAQPFCFAEYVLAPKNGRYTVVQASECESFYSLRTDLEKFYAACAVCETALALTYEGDCASEIFSSCVRALTQMSEGDHIKALVAYLLNALKRAGYGVDTGRCAECGARLSEERGLRFDMESGGFTCRDCGTGIGASFSTLQLLRGAVGEKCDESCLLPDANKRALRLLNAYLTYKTEVKVSSLAELIRMI